MLSQSATLSTGMHALVNSAVYAQCIVKVACDSGPHLGRFSGGQLLRRFLCDPWQPNGSVGCWICCGTAS